MLQADLINAYNQVDRGKVLEETARHFPECLAWAKTCYGAPSFLKFGLANILSALGLHQGDPLALLLMSHPNRGFLAPKWVTHHFWEIHICGAAPLSINAILPICEGLVAARMTLCAVVNTSHPHIPETHQESRMKAFVG